MPSLRKLALIGLSAGLLMGCDAGSSPDNQARTKINDGRIAAARGTTPAATPPPIFARPRT